MSISGKAIHHHGRGDAIGVALSVLCAIHCLSVPFMLTVLPSLGLSILANHEFEWFMVGIIIAVAAWVGIGGFREHGKRSILVFFVIGAAIFIGVRPALPEAFHPLATILGGSMFLIGHGLNWKFKRAHCPSESCGSH